jgi:Uma2 family endonuclease
MTTRHPDVPERRLTVDDLENTPDDGRRYELADGRLDVSPAPTNKHCRVANRLSFHLNLLCNGEFEIGEGPGVNLNSERTSHRIPDLAVFDYDIPEEKYFDIPPLLAVEIVSPESRFRDLNVKPQKYAEAGIPHFWRVEDEDGTTAIHVYELDETSKSYVPTTIARESLNVDRPFPTKIDVRALVD